MTQLLLPQSPDSVELRAVSTAHRRAPGDPSAAACGHARRAAGWPIRRHVAAVCVLTLAAGALRLARLEQPSMWYDELRTLHGAITRDVGYSKLLGYLPHSAWLAASGIKTTPELAERPEAWRGLGIDEWSARMPACLLGIVTVPILYLAGCRVLGPAASLAAALLLATSMWHVYWSQTARFYAVQFLFYNVGLLCYLRWRQTRRPAVMIAAILCTVLAALCQPTAIVLLGVFAVDGFLGAVTAGRGRAAMWTAALLLIPAATIGAALGVDVFRNPRDWAHFFQKSNLPPFRLVFSSAYFIGPAVVLAAMLAAWHALRRRDGLGVGLLIAATLPIAAFTIVGLFGRVELRYCLPALHAWLCLAAVAAVACLRQAPIGASRAVGAAGLACLFGAQLVPLYQYYASNGLRPEIREAAAFVQKHRRPGEAVFMDPLEGGYYLQQPVTGDPPAAPGIDESGGAAWLVYRDDERGTLPAPQPWTDDNTVLRAVFGADGIGRMARVHVRYRPRS